MSDDSDLPPLTSRRAEDTQAGTGISADSVNQESHESSAIGHSRQSRSARSKSGWLRWIKRLGAAEPESQEALSTPRARAARRRRKRALRAAQPKAVKVRSAYSDWDSGTEATFLEMVSDTYNRRPDEFDRVMVSIVLPTFNRGSVVIAAINSVLKQTHPRWELIIVDDGSTDDTAERIAHFTKDRRIRYLRLDRSGVSAARNKGLESAVGDYVFYIDSDNTWSPVFLRTMVVFMETGGIGAAFGAIEAKDDDGLVNYRGAPFDWEACLRQNYIDLNSFGHRRAGVQGKCHFDETLLRLVDWDFILRVTASTPTAYAPFLGVSYYAGTKGSRITVTEYPGDTLKRAEDGIRAKHQQHSVPPPGLQWSDLMQRTARFRAAELVEVDEHLVDWPALRASVDDRTPGLASIIILALDNAELTRDCVASILAGTEPGGYEIILVDNGSTAESTASFLELTRLHAQVRLVCNPSNYFFSVGNNVGAKFSSGEFLVFLNNDTRVCPGWLPPLVTRLKTDPAVGAVGPKLLYPDETLQCGGLVFSEQSKVSYHIYQGLDRRDTAVSTARAFQALTGACLGLRAADFISLKGFDPSYLNGCEDIELCFRVSHELGKSCWYLPSSEVFHLESKTPNRGRYINYNRERFVDRWRDKIRADDAIYYAEDGFDVENYHKPGREPDGETASYVPVLRRQSQETEAVTAPKHATPRIIKVGFSTIWHARGISFHARQLALALEGGLFEAHIFARWESEKFQNAGPIYHPRVTNFGDDPTPGEIVDWARSRGLDLVIFMEVHPKDWKRVRALKAAGVRVLCYENLDVMRLADIARYEVFDCFLFNAFHTRHVVLSRFPKALSLTVPWGIPLSVDGDAVPRDGGPVRFVHVAGWGGLNDRKNTPLVVRAFARARPDNAVLHLYTQGPLASFGSATVDTAARLENIQVHEGTVDNIFEAYRGKDMLLAPSKREGLGLPIVEALASGLPVLVTDGYMMKQWIVEGEHGLLCPATPIDGDRALAEMSVDEDELSRMIGALSTDPGRITDMAKNVARDREVWAWSWQPEVLREQLTAVVEGHAPPSDLSYLPEFVTAFERRRSVAEAQRLGRAGSP